MVRVLAFAVVALAALALPAAAQETPPPAEDFVISDDLTALPVPVRQMRDTLIAATKSGDIQALRAIIHKQGTVPRVSFGDPEDPIDYLKSASADGEGLETLAIMADVLAAPYGILGANGVEPSYVWPYLAGMGDITALTPAQKVDAYRILPPDQFDTMVELEGWLYWRLFIGANGQWQAFVAGD